MDVCHLLFGHPWQYDRKVQQDGFKNTYSFVKDSVEIILGPSKHGLISKPSKGVETLMVTCFEMEKLVNDVDVAYIIAIFFFKKMLK